MESFIEGLFCVFCTAIVIYFLLPVAMYINTKQLFQGKYDAYFDSLKKHFNEYKQKKEGDQNG